MAFVLYPFAIVSNGHISRFADSLNDISDGEVALPVVADPDPAIAPNEKIVGPEFEVLGDRVRAYGRVERAEDSEIVKLTFAQLLIGLVAEKWVTEVEGEAWLSGSLPVPVLSLISMLPPEQRFPAKARAVRPSEVLRRDPLVEALGKMQGKTPQELDEFFFKYAQV